MAREISPPRWRLASSDSYRKPDRGNPFPYAACQKLLVLTIDRRIVKAIGAIPAMKGHSPAANTQLRTGKTSRAFRPLHCMVFSKFRRLKNAHKTVGVNRPGLA